MEEKAKKGRPARSESSSYLIKDVSTSPYFIEKDNYNFTILENSKPTRGFGTGEIVDREVVKTVSYHSTLSGALESIIKLKFHNDSSGKEYNSLYDYINDYKTIEKNISQILNKINL